jgi:hypothetical protein
MTLSSAPTSDRRAEQRPRVVVPVTLAVVCIAGAVLIGLDVHGPVRAVVVLVGLIAGSGYAVTGWLREPDGAYASSMAIGTGVAILILGSLFFVYVGWWHPVGVCLIALVASGVSILLQVEEVRARLQERWKRGARRPSGGHYHREGPV